MNLICSAKELRKLSYPLTPDIYTRFEILLGLRYLHQI